MARKNHQSISPIFQLDLNSVSSHATYIMWRNWAYSRVMPGVDCLNQAVTSTTISGWLRKTMSDVGLALKSLLHPPCALQLAPKQHVTFHYRKRLLWLIGTLSVCSGNTIKGHWQPTVNRLTPSWLSINVYYWLFHVTSSWWPHPINITAHMLLNDYLWCHITWVVHVTLSWFTFVCFNVCFCILAVLGYFDDSPCDIMVLPLGHTTWIHSNWYPVLICPTIATIHYVSSMRLCHSHTTRSHLQRTGLRCLWQSIFALFKKKVFVVWGHFSPWCTALIGHVYAMFFTETSYWLHSIRYRCLHVSGEFCQCHSGFMPAYITNKS